MSPELKYARDKSLPPAAQFFSYSFVAQRAPAFMQSFKLYSNNCYYSLSAGTLYLNTAFFLYL
jgi:hypothetical protein